MNEALLTLWGRVGWGVELEVNRGRPLNAGKQVDTVSHDVLEDRSGRLIPFCYRR